MRVDTGLLGPGIVEWLDVCVRPLTRREGKPRVSAVTQDGRLTPASRTWLREMIESHDKQQRTRHTVVSAEALKVNSQIPFAHIGRSQLRSEGVVASRGAPRQM